MEPQEEARVVPGGRRPPNSASNASGGGPGMWFRPDIFAGRGSVGAEDVILFLASEIEGNTSTEWVIQKSTRLTCAASFKNTKIYELDAQNL